jgi:hypothetical protein
MLFFAISNSVRMDKISIDREALLVSNFFVF